jgi:deferrochelatase/peroxidase EfeB
MRQQDSGEPMDPSNSLSPGPSRRRVLAGAGVFGAGAVAGGLGGYLGGGGGGSADAGEGAGGSGQTIPFHGAHQAGIATPAQDRLAFGTLNVVSGTSPG